MGNCFDVTGKTSRGLPRFASLALVLLLAGGCAGPIKSLYPPQAGQTPRPVYVINHGALHTGLAVRRSDIPRAVWPAQRDYAGSKYLEVGWGDDDGYRRPLTVGIAAKAMLGSKRTVLLTNGFNALSDRRETPRFTIIEVDLSPRGFARLCQHIERTYALDEAGQSIRLGHGWYRARGTYSAFHTCNTWAAEGLRQAGCPINPFYCLTPGPLLRQTRQFGRVLSQPRSR